MSKNTNYSTVLWDWNGTVLNDLDATMQAVNDLLAVYEKPPITLEQYYSYIDTPIYKFYEHIFDLSVVTMEMIKPIYGKAYADREGMIALTRGAEEALRSLEKAGKKQYILSAAHIDDVVIYTEKYGITDIFRRIEAAADYEAGSKIERGKRLMLEEGIDPSTCVMIGDTLHDLETADALGVDCILFSGGHTDYATLAKTGVPTCTSFGEIMELITG